MRLIFSSVLFSVAVTSLLGCSGAGYQDDVGSSADIAAPAEPASLKLDTSPLAPTPGVAFREEGAMNPLTRIDLPNDGTIKFYEPDPGFVFVVETGRMDAPRHRGPQEDKMDPDQLYVHLTGKAAPPRLADAAKRHNAGRPKQSTTSDVGTQSQALVSDDTQNWFLSNYCTGNYAFQKIAVGAPRSLEWDVSAWVTFHANAMSMRNSVHFVSKYTPIYFTYKTLVDVTLDEGYYASSHGSGISNYRAKAWVDQSDHSLYDFCAGAF